MFILQNNTRTYCKYEHLHKHIHENVHELALNMNIYRNMYMKMYTNMYIVHEYVHEHLHENVLELVYDYLREKKWRVNDDTGAHCPALSQTCEPELFCVELWRKMYSYIFVSHIRGRTRWPRWIRLKLILNLKKNPTSSPYFTSVPRS